MALSVRRLVSTGSLHLKINSHYGIRKYKFLTISPVTSIFESKKADYTQFVHTLRKCEWNFSDRFRSMMNSIIKIRNIKIVLILQSFITTIAIIYIIVQTSNLEQISRMEGILWPNN